MRPTRRFLPRCSLYDQAGLARWLEEKARGGWLLERAGGGLGWRFRAVPPQEVTFAVVYYPAASRYDGAVSPEQEEFYALCAHHGWRLADALGEIQIFYNTRQDPVPIETDEAVELEQIRRVARKQALSHELPVGLLSLAALLLFLWVTVTRPIYIFSDPIQLFIGACWLSAVLSAGSEGLQFALWHRKARRAVERGAPLPPRKTSWAGRLMACLTFVLVGVGVVLAWQGGMGRLMLLTVVALAAVTGFLVSLAAGMKREKRPAKETKRTLFAGGLLFSLVLLAGVLLVTAPRQEEVLYPDGSRQVLSAFPSVERRATPFLAQETGTSGQVPGWNYERVQVKFPPLYGPCRGQLFREQTQRFGSAQWEDPAPWGAQAAYRFEDGGGETAYLICRQDTFTLWTGQGPLTRETMTRLSQESPR